MSSEIHGLPGSHLDLTTVYGASLRSMRIASLNSHLASRPDSGVVCDSVSGDDVTRLMVLEAMSHSVEAAPTGTTEPPSVRECADESPNTETIMLTHDRAVAIACDSGLLLVSSVESGRAQIDYDDAMFDVLLRVDAELTLYDGALIGAGQSWFRYENADQSRPPCLQELDPDGKPRRTVAMHDQSLTLGRAFGDLILPDETELAALHLRIVRSDGEAWLSNLAGPGKTWLWVPPTQQVPADGTIAVGDRLLQLLAPSPVGSEETGPRMPLMQPVPREARGSFDAHVPA